MTCRGLFSFYCTCAMQEFLAGNKNINKGATIRAMSVSCLPRIHTWHAHAQ